MKNWKINETSFVPEKLRENETLFTTGNGYLCTRGSFEEGFRGEQAATFIHGVFDDIQIANTELVNTPNWINCEILLDGDRFQMDSGRLLFYERQLDLHTGVLTRHVRWQSPSGKTAELWFERFASLGDEHLAVVRIRILALDFEGVAEVRASLPGQVDNQGWVHWNHLDQGALNERSAFLCLQTKATKINLSEAVNLQLSSSQVAESQVWDAQGVPTVTARIHLNLGEHVSAEKRVALFTSRDVEDPKRAAVEKLARLEALDYDSLRAGNDRAWVNTWHSTDIRIEGDDRADLAVRFNLFQLLIAAPRQDERVSIPAKSLSGFGYRGHVFWDTEIFILPFFAYTQPKIARNLLLYRYHTLPEAKQKARQKGYQGALFAWESAATGEETTPRWVPEPDGNLVRIWPGDIEHHISADIAFGIMLYWNASGDDDFMQNYGAEILLETACFWGSRVEWNAQKNVYEINNVIGPDENHDHVDNNAYTNHLARWNLQAALQTLDWLRENAPHKADQLVKEMKLSPSRLEQWQKVIDRIQLNYDSESRLIEQFDGYYDLKMVDLQEYEPRHRSMQALLGIEGVQEYQYSKQPDVVMMLYLLEGQYDRSALQKNLQYYTPRTDLSHGSSLGPAIQALALARSGDLETAYQYFMQAAYTDLENNRGNTADGIHAATAGGLLQAVIFGFGGLHIQDHRPVADPRIPANWKSLEFKLQYQGQEYAFKLKTGAADQAARRTGSKRTKPVEINHSHGPQGVIFDLDGVLTDTSELHYRAWKRLADEEEIPFTREDNEALRGVSRRESLLRLLNGREVPEEELQEMMDRKNRYYQELIADLGPQDLLPGAQRFLRETREAGIKIAIGSASKNARAVIEKLNIDKWADAISDGYSVACQKPEPHLFLHAAAQLRLPREQCVVFEDAQAGVEAALRAGMWSVGIGPRQRVGAADLILPDLEDSSWKDVSERLLRMESATS